MLAVTVVESSLHAIENAAADAHSLTGVQKSPDGASRLQFQNTLQGFYFMIRNGEGLIVRSSESEHAARLQHRQARLPSAPQADEHISLKERRVNCFASVAPAMYGFEQGQKALDLPLAQD